MFALLSILASSRIRFHRAVIKLFGDKSGMKESRRRRVNEVLRFCDSFALHVPARRLLLGRPSRRVFRPPPAPRGRGRPGGIRRYPCDRDDEFQNQIHPRVPRCSNHGDGPGRIPALSSLAGAG